MSAIGRPSTPYPFDEDFEVIPMDIGMPAEEVKAPIKHRIKAAFGSAFKPLSPVDSAALAAKVLRERAAAVRGMQRENSAMDIAERMIRDGEFARSHEYMPQWRDRPRSA